ncbi:MULTISPECIES: hypothetical protein [Rhizobium]|uniref:hypothetical protein n=1 Tax=Rhizobium TaxID=379 RepID=UPI00119B5598|nr:MULTISPECIES: hypothetical protein [Rhizobium]MBB3290125.1 hypothetical protein [Rhizobium sp. BK252]MBB3404987.1 hypothetical protein [Rhizobium sp. BK289]MBB3417533.1 hypothetical protein [Rhizobium sp. BK284]MBB3485243.1 hypothetical protein [Rhizobium sp. BK347]MDK4720922.1 hypothetical protein [Rhizobium sp. CNPSo 3968]
MAYAATSRQFTPSTDSFVDRLESARLQIEQRFLDGGAVLITVTEALAKLVSLLEHIGSSLKEENATEATARLLQTVDLLNKLPPAEARRHACVASISQTGQSLAEHVLSMEETLRYLRTFAATAKIAGARIPDFSSFASEIVERIEFATKEVKALSLQIRSLEVQIETAAASEDGSLAQHLNGIPSIVQRLVSNAEEIQVQRRNLSELADTVAGLARKIQSKVAHTLSAMQIGDITRQRVEHCQAAHMMTEAYLASEAPADLSAADRQRLSQLTMTLIFELLGETTKGFDRETAKIVDNIRGFSGDIGTLLNLYQTMMSQSGEDGKSPIHSLRGDLSAARAVVDRIDVAAAGANRLSEKTSEMVKELTASIQTIQLVRRDIQYMALNTNLRCGKLGEEGRAINVVAGELRSFASLLDEDAEKILVGLGTLETQTAGLKDWRQTGEPENSSGLGSHIDAALVHIGEAGASMDMNVRELRQCGETMTSQVTEIVASLDFRSGIGEILASCTSEAALARRAFAGTSGLEVPVAAISERIFKIYTMAAEREIHASIFGVVNPVAESGPAPASDEELFADALF